MSAQELKIRCDVKDFLNVEDFVNLQGNLKTLSEENYKKLRKSILTRGFTAPIFVWKNENKILDGHQRIRTIQQMIKSGDISCKKLPVVNIEADNEDEARKMLGDFVSQFGRVDEQGLYEFAIQSNWSPQEIMNDFDIPNINMPEFLESHWDGFKIDDKKNEDENLYTKKIEAPIYEIKGEKPSFEEMLSLDKSHGLITEINSCPELSDAEKTFLTYAAHRHNVFNYEKIAEFYAHASPVVKNLMEKSALVIIDFDKAIENGFVIMSEVLADLCAQDTSVNMPSEDVDE